MNQRYQSMFAHLKRINEGAFVPFVVLGDPTPELSMQIIEALVAGGADALELGIPFSDPLADGPTIQAAATRALKSGVTPALCFDILKTVRNKYPEMPIGLLVYANLVLAPGLGPFYQRCAQTGVDSVLVADVPVEMSAPFKGAAKNAGIASIFIAPPNADETTLKTISAQGSGYTYLLSRSGVTGAEIDAGMPVKRLMENLNKFQAPPVLLGFGISRPEQVKEAIAAGAAGVISGSAVVRIIEQQQDTPVAALKAVTDFVTEMKIATRNHFKPV